MKVLQFTIPVAHDKSVIFQEDRLPHFYPYLHRHLEVQLTWVVKGAGTLVAGTGIYPFNAGDIFLLGANQPHVFKSDPAYFDNQRNKQTHSVTVFFDPLKKLKTLFELPELRLIQSFIERRSTGFKIPSAYTSAVSDKISGIKNARAVDRLLLFLDLLKRLYSLDRHLEPLSKAMSGKVSENEGMRIRNVYDYIMQNYSAGVSLEKVSAIAHMTPQAFCRYFKKQTGNTFVSFLNEVRINEACKKMMEHDFESVSGVAYTTGFNSITNFNRVFKSVTGKSPLEYLKAYKRGAF